MGNSILVDIEIDEILEQMRDSEKINLFEELLYELDADEIIEILSNHANKDIRSKSMFRMQNKFSLWENVFNENLIKISNNYLQLNQHEMDAIEAISKKF
jgi:hypothetical protein